MSIQPMSDARERNEAAVIAGEAKDGGGMATLRAWHGGARQVAILSGRYGVVLVVILLFVIFSFLRPSTFPTSANITTMAETEAVAVILAFAVLVPLVVGEFDISVANVLGFAGVETAALAPHMPLAYNLIVVLMTGVAIGAVNGFVVVKLGLNSFIATIGTSTAIGGMSLALSNGQVLFRNLPDQLFQIGQRDVFHINLSILYAVVIGLVLWYVLQHTPIGRHLYGVGGNPDVARLSGIRVQAVRWSSFVVAGLLASFAGIVEMSQIGSADPTFGPSFMLPAFAAVFLGATTIRPGTPNVLGVAFAVTLLTISTTGLGQLGAPFYVEPIFNGVVLVTAVALSIMVLRVAPGRGRVDREGK